MKSWLRKDQTPDDLKGVYDRGYYDYLRSDFHGRLMSIVGTMAQEVYGPVLDVACGEGRLSSRIIPTWGYVGFDGSSTAIETAISLYGGSPFRSFHVGRIECPEALARLYPPFGTIVFGNIFYVTVDPKHQIELIHDYLHRFGARQFIVVDLERFDTSRIDSEFKCVEYYGLSSEPFDDLPDVKLHRKVRRYLVP